MSSGSLYHRRHLPHWQPFYVDVFLTWRLHGSLPAGLRPPKVVATSGRHFVETDRQLDHARTGPLWLKEPQVAEAVVAALLAQPSRRLFRLGAFAIMADHVHVLLTPLAPVSEITRRIKGATAREANSILHRTGSRFWQDESFDHWVRNPGEWQKIRAYIENNPVAAGLVIKPEDWPWSSAASRTGFSLSGLDVRPIQI